MWTLSAGCSGWQVPTGWAAGGRPKASCIARLDSGGSEGSLIVTLLRTCLVKHGRAILKKLHPEVGDWGPDKEWEQSWGLLPVLSGCTRAHQDVLPLIKPHRSRTRLCSSGWGLLLLWMTHPGERAEAWTQCCLWKALFLSPFSFPQDPSEYNP